MAKEMARRGNEQTVMSRRGQQQNPVREMLDLRDTISGIFDDFFSGKPLFRSVVSESQGWTPPVDIKETENEVLVYAGLPGIGKDECSIEVRDNTLIISGQCKQAESQGKNEMWIRSELPSGQFYRAFTLPADVNAEQVKATYMNGLLEIHLPKSEQAKPHKVEIQ